MPGQNTVPLERDIESCTLCAARFRATASSHRPRPVVWFKPQPLILIAGQAPGRQVYEHGRPFFDRSGDRLRDWMGIDQDTFYDRSRISILPTAFCFPGNDVRGADLPPPPICWDTWHAKCLDHIGTPALRLLVGSYAIRRHLGRQGPLTQTVGAWREFAPATFVLPHPSWRNNAWLRKNPWFTSELLPALRSRVHNLLSNP